MQIVELDWLIQQTKKKRGIKADLARHLKMEPAKLSRILSGERRISVQENQSILDFFNLADHEETRLSGSVAERFDRLTTDQRKLVEGLIDEFSKLNRIED